MKTQIIGIRNRRDSTRHPTVTNKITEYYTQFYANKFNNFHEIEKHLANLNLPDKIENLNCPISILKIEL